ncbi:MAG: MaoC family dehydratase N-terminal domain-containing protein [Candidatus Bathyarchaeia archaeon]
MDTVFAEARIDEQMLSEVRKFIGTEIRIDHSVNNEEATRTAILKFADGIGDPNPLWRDFQFASKTPYGNIVAPPSWVFSVFAGTQYGFRGLGGFHNRTHAYFYRPVYLGDKIVPKMKCLDIVGPKKSQFAGQVLIEKNETTYTNHNNQVVAKVFFDVIHFERRRARKKGKYSKYVLPHPWTEEQLKEIEEESLKKTWNEETPFWEDVEVGHELGPLVKGPFTMTDVIAFLIGGGAPIPRLCAHGVALRHYRKHPAWCFRDPTSKGLEPIFAVHYNFQAAKAQGLPYPYDIGFQRQCWQIQLLTDFAGPEGWVKESYCEYRGFVFYSDVVRLRGKVVEKFIDEEGEYCVRIETEATNQRGDNVMPGYGIVALRSRSGKTSPAERRRR